MPAEQTAVRVDLGPRSYDVRIGAGIRAEVGGWTAARLDGTRRTNRRAFVVVDDGLPDDATVPVLVGLESAGFAVTTAELHAAETRKTLATAEALLVELADSRADRGDVVVAVGGGIAGDVAGFVAAVYKRGLAVVQVPTTLLAMVDASVGGKTAVNLATGTGLKKNLVGAFWQPLLVAADVEVLASLPPRAFRSGLAESLKHALLAGGAGEDPGLLDWTRERLPQLADRDPGVVERLVARNVAVKARVVGGDERETASADGRALLNLGHTFAHALELVAALSPTGDPADAPLQHGEAVALGLVAAGAAAVHMGMLSPDDAEVIRSMVDGAGLPSRLAGLPADEALLETMRHDKKVRGGALRLVLPTRLGACTSVTEPPAAAIAAGFAALRSPSTTQV